MKTKLNSKANERGLWLLLVGFIVVLLIVLGVIVYLIWKWSQMPPPKRGIDITYVGSTTSASEVEEITGAPPPATTTAAKSSEPVLQQAEAPDGMVMTELVLERSTNMVDWIDVRSIDVSNPSVLSNVFLLDTNFVSDRAFYRTRSVYQWP